MYFWHILGWERINNVFEFSGFSKYDFSFSQIPGWSVFLAAAVLLATQYKHMKTKTVRKVKVIPKNYNYRKITEHFKPQVVKTDVQNEPEPESKAKKGGESQLLVDVEKITTVTRPPDVLYV